MTDRQACTLVVKDFSVAFDDNLVLRDLTMAPPPGAKSVLIGPAASGKSVLLKCLIGLYQPSSGSIRIDDRELVGAGTSTRAEIVEEIGISFQQRGLFDSLPVWENVSFKLINARGMPRPEARALAIEKLALVDLPASTADLFPADLSGGMQKRVGLARALMGEPRLLLLDEPTAGLDPVTTSRINEIIRRTTEDHPVTTISITSDMESARQIYDHLFMLHDGHMVWSGPTSEIESSDNAFLRQLIDGHARGPIKSRIWSRDHLRAELGPRDRPNP